MTYTELLTAIYGHFDRLLNAPKKETGADGAFVFLPESYAEAESFDRVRFEFWPVRRVRQFLHTAGQTDEGLTELMEDLEPEEEFLVMIVEEEADGQLRMVHIHKITDLGLN